jgi:hypothetical protein
MVILIISKYQFTSPNIVLSATQPKIICRYIVVGGLPITFTENPSKYSELGAQNTT